MWVLMLEAYLIKLNLKHTPFDHYYKQIWLFVFHSITDVSGLYTD